MKCPLCNDEMEERIVEWKKGIYVRTEFCSKCGEKWLDLEEHERAMAEFGIQNVTKLRRSVIKLGSSLAVRLPKDIVESFGIKEKDQVEIYSTREGIVLNPKKIESDSD
ncbi:MAG: AbrB/MazE/SpoVT family DNA-binding domain-containing protein [Candidatus Hydrothermarchaeales archaeon]